MKNQPALVGRLRGIESRFLLPPKLQSDSIFSTFGCKWVLLKIIINDALNISDKKNFIPAVFCFFIF